MSYIPQHDPVVGHPAVVVSHEADIPREPPGETKQPVNDALFASTGPQLNPHLPHLHYVPPNPPFPLPELRPHVPYAPYVRNNTVVRVPGPPRPNVVPVGTQPLHPNPYPLHGPLQAEKLAYANEAAAKRLAANELKKIKEAEKAAEKLAKEERKRAEKEAREAKKQAEKEAKEAEKEAKEAQRMADRQAKEAEQVARRKGRAKSGGTRERRAPGDSDDEINNADPDEIKNAAIQPIVKQERTKKWADDESLKAIRHIISPRVWRSFKLRQTIVFREVSEAVLLGSKDPKQVANFWQSCWKKFKACRRRENHTGGGDGDKLLLDDMHEEVGLEGEGDALTGDEAKPATKREPVDSAQIIFSDSVLDRFEASEIYQLILKVAGNHPEVLKDEEFDSARPLSDSEDETTSRRRKRSAESDTDMDLALKTYEIISTSIASFGETRKANLELSNRRDIREEKAEKDRLESLQLERELSQQRFEWEREAHAREMHRIELEERRVRLEEQDRRRLEWAEAKEMLRLGIDELVEQGRRMVRHLQAKEDKEDSRP